MGAISIQLIIFALYFPISYLRAHPQLTQARLSRCPNMGSYLSHGQPPQKSAHTRAGASVEGGTQPPGPAHRNPRLFSSPFLLLFLHPPAFSLLSFNPPQAEITADPIVGHLLALRTESKFLYCFAIQYSSSRNAEAKLPGKETQMFSFPTLLLMDRKVHGFGRVNFEWTRVQQHTSFLQLENSQRLENRLLGLMFNSAIIHNINSDGKKQLVRTLLFWDISSQSERKAL